MRPISLTVEGFTSFAERTEVDFSNLDLFAITGPTGSGKTSLLDAMTWALYGKTTRLGKTAADLISHGIDRVSVHLEFAAGGHRYRVARTAKRSGSLPPRLEKYEGEWSPVDASGAVETNEAVRRIVGLDFEAFTRSVILPQGKFDAFLRGEHKDRREILKTLLGLEVYDRMRELAVQKRDRLRTEEDALSGVIERDYASATGENLACLNACLRKAQKQQKENAVQAQRAEQLKTIARELRQDRNLLLEKQGALAMAENDYRAGREIARLRSSEVETIRQAIELAQDELASITVDDVLYARLVTLKERAATLAQLERSRLAAVQSRQKVRGELDLKTKELDLAGKSAELAEAAHAACDHACDEARKRLDQGLLSGSADLLESLRDTFKKVPSQREALAGLGRLRMQLAGEGDSLHQQLAKLEPALVAAQSALEKARHDLEHLTVHNAHRGLRVGLNKGERCPVCEQMVVKLPKVPPAGALESARALVKKSEEELTKIQSAITKAESQLDGLPSRLKDIDNRIAVDAENVEIVAKRVHSVTGSLPDAECLVALNRAVAGIREAQQGLKTSEEKLRSARSAARLAQAKVVALDKDVIGLSERLAGIAEEVGRLGLRIEQLLPEIEAAGGADRIASSLNAIGDAKQHKERVAAALKNLGGELRAAEAKKSQAEQQVAILQERMSGLNADIERLTEATSRLHESWLKLEEGFNVPPNGDEAGRAAKKRQELEDERIRISHEIVRIESSAKEIEIKISQLDGLRKDLEKARNGRCIYEQLATALRADRFIAYLLETAYADLCEKGSEYLMLLSGERYSFTASKNEFCIKDEWNGGAERSASTLSGGESFLASLALALALSDSVASFASDGNPGAKLEALFLDEGVSTLDQDETLPTVIDALVSLQTGDRLIGVISHMENLAERLPGRVEVVKNKGRSSIRTIDAVARTSV